jgi:spermidine dehydrogenase
MSGDHQPHPDRKLGEDRCVPRRDFLQGTLIGAATALNGPLLAGLAEAASRSAAPIAAQDQPGYYPPLLTGLRGSHPGSFEAAHALRDGSSTPSATDTGESYDLVVVGGGISGLAAAQFFRAAAAF